MGNACSVHKEMKNLYRVWIFLFEAQSVESSRKA